MNRYVFGKQKAFFKIYNQAFAILAIPNADGARIRLSFPVFHLIEKMRFSWVQFAKNILTEDTYTFPLTNLFEPPTATNFLAAF